MRPAARSCLKGAVGLLAVAGISGCGTLSMLDADPVVTGSLKPQTVSAPVPEGPVPQGIGASDWSHAKMALAQALQVREAGASMPWDNPATGARGTATPLGAVKDNGCRDFRIGLVDTTGEHWIQGEACKDGKGETSLSQVRVLGRA
ncbi:RT0821/Lpp0805 family surface protein [Aquabacter sp. P-9]|uniref:RT0821/Lpp0805 family surface protein n=1 Tax=Aquabacter sediminis TaxID=3029197 RepID=UPI00237DF94E|nr:RT0821/Lpp0805 family surface protein [Aquabacter sp. P-9]MDE1566897.1 RT0821/Lpp0805 family surface protein [Aquabacter sp. P-9]